MRYSKITFFCLFLLALILVECDKPQAYQIPSVFMDFTINIKQDVEFQHLISASSSQIIEASSVGLITLGYDNNGVIIFNAGGEFYAFDRTCPHDFPNSIAITTDGGASAECPECKSIFVLPSLGMPADGSVSKYPLKAYRVEDNPTTGQLHVYN